MSSRRLEVRVIRGIGSNPEILEIPLKDNSTTKLNLLVFRGLSLSEKEVSDLINISMRTSGNPCAALILGLEDKFEVHEVEIPSRYERGPVTVVSFARRERRRWSTQANPVQGLVNGPAVFRREYLGTFLEEIPEPIANIYYGPTEEEREAIIRSVIPKEDEPIQATKPRIRSVRRVSRYKRKPVI
jgi:hypothetical protein